jgi:hypothetical protein
MTIHTIIEHYGKISNETPPDICILLNYFNNMISALEFLFKILAKDWESINRSKFGHNLSKMYKIIFGQDYKKSDLLILLQQAICDQKYNLEPCSGLFNRIPEIEDLWDELEEEFRKQNYKKLLTVNKNIIMDGDFIQYLIKNLYRFYCPTITSNKPISTEELTKKYQEYQDKLQSIITILNERKYIDFSYDTYQFII